MFEPFVGTAARFGGSRNPASNYTNSNGYSRPLYRAYPDAPPGWHRNTHTHPHYGKPDAYADCSCNCYAYTQAYPNDYPDRQTNHNYYTHPRPKDSYRTAANPRHQCYRG